MATDQDPNTPYVPPHERLPEATALAIGMGLILAIVMGAANIYLGLYAGMTVSASIPAAVVSMAILRGIFRRGTILENNIAQTIASTGESLAAGAIFTIPTLVLVGAWTKFEFWPTTFIVMFGGLLGIVFMVPLRRALIVERPDLIYPEGVACSKVLITGQEGGAGIRYIGLGFAVGAVFKFLVSGIGVIKHTVEGAFAIGRSAFYCGSDMSVALLAVGYIVNLRIASQVFIGGALGWAIAIPILGGFEEGGVPLETAWDLWSTQVRYIGVGAMLVGGVHSIWSVRSGIMGALSGLRSDGGNSSPVDEEIPRTERDIPYTALMTIFFLTVIATLFLYNHLIGGAFTISLAATAAMVVCAFIFVAVATYISGLVGGSNSPVSGMTICALLIAAGVLLAMGIEGDSAILACLGVAGVVCCAACTSGDVAQDLKTGILVGATPARQQWAEMTGVVIPAFIFAPVLTMLHDAYIIGSPELLAPQAQLFASLAKGMFGDGDLPYDMIAVGAGIGLAILVVDFILDKLGSGARAYIMPIAVGIYLPFALAVPIFIGGLVRALTTPKNLKSGDNPSSTGILLGSGLIAGEALMGIGLAIVISAGITLPSFDIYSAISLALFGSIIAGYALLTRKSA